MRRTILNKLWIIPVLLVAFTACKTRKQAVTEPVKKTVNRTGSKEAILRDIAAKQLNFKTLSVKAKTNFSIDNKDNDVTMNIRIQKDEKIWVSVTAIAGIEVARALITPDSLKILNRIEGTYIRKPFSYIYRYANREINFKTLQSLLVGNCPPEFISDNSILNFNNAQNPSLSGETKSLTYAVNFNAATKVIGTLLKDAESKQELNVRYSDFNAVSDQAMPFSVDIKSIAASKNVALLLHYNQVSINETLDFPFSVPKRFSVID
ncbi:DUF4292 domain-containing protein [Rubrolithibacter danxiaensis]|uniref:DUF4292 domain-containing protein n=1 Tax=Rubrolithibacter danxiaensis TaxID=3390805 RepID=UPI003BF82964